MSFNYKLHTVTQEDDIYIVIFITLNLCDQLKLVQVFHVNKLSLEKNQH